MRQDETDRLAARFNEFMRAWKPHTGPIPSVEMARRIRQNCNQPGVNNASSSQGAEHCYSMPPYLRVDLMADADAIVERHRI